MDDRTEKPNVTKDTAATTSTEGKVNSLDEKVSEDLSGWLSLPPEKLKELQDSVTIVDPEWNTEEIKSQIINPELYWATIVHVNLSEYEWYNTSLWNVGIDVAYDISRKDPTKKIILIYITSLATLKKSSEKRNSDNHVEKLTILENNWNFKFLGPFSLGAKWAPKVLNNCFNESENNFKPTITKEALQKSIKLTGDGFDHFIGWIENPILKWVNLIYMHLNEYKGESYRRDAYWGIEAAYDIQNNDPQKKIIMYWWFDRDSLINKKDKTGISSVMHDKLLVLNWSSNFRYLQLPFRGNDLNNCFVKEWEVNSATQVFEAEKRIAIQNIRIIRHSIEPYKVKDPYNPQNNNERRYVEHAFELTQKYFPWSDTVEKMLDFVLHVNVDIPEVMKWERIEGVYVDVDGTLIDYVPIWSTLEGTQQLRQKVVELLKKYESEGKKIIIWTWGDVQMKEKYLRTLWITWPVVSKYDYAGAVAEIVLDDNDKSAFILKSKILPLTYIDTRKME